MDQGRAQAMPAPSRVDGDRTQEDGRPAVDDDVPLTHAAGHRFAVPGDEGQVQARLAPLAQAFGGLDEAAWAEGGVDHRLHGGVIILALGEDRRQGGVGGQDANGGGHAMQRRWGQGFDPES